MNLNVGYSTLDDVAPTRFIDLEVTPSHRTKSEPVMSKSERHGLEWVPSISFVNHLISRAFCETIRMTFGVYVYVCVCVCVCVQGISPSITGRILMKLRMDIPVHHAQCVWQTIENRSKVKVKVTENTKTTIWAITFEPEVVETSG